jgi:CubicO group peptidase (beta-lactamase class C family)
MTVPRSIAPAQSFLCAFGLLLLPFLFRLACSADTYPETKWAYLPPHEAGLSPEKLDALRGLVGGRGCVVRHGFMVYSWGDESKSSDVASAMKPIISTLLLMAVEEGKITGVDEPVADFEPRLKMLNGDKDAGITWRHLASQTSGYGLAEPPGECWSYNDFALALYYDTLTQKVFRTNGTEVLRTRLAEPLQFEDHYTFEAFGPNDRPGRLALSVRDFARFGLLYLRGGNWRDRQLLKPELVRLAITSPVAANTRLTSGKDANMLPHQRSIGGSKNITPVGPGFYSFNWWLNLTNNLGQRLFVDAPSDTFVASGHGGMRMLWVIPSLDLIVCWNDSLIEDHDASPGNPNTKCNQAARLMVEAVQLRAGTSIAADTLNEHRGSHATTILGVAGTRFTLNGRPTFLYGISYYGALGAREDFIRRDLDDMQKSGFNWIRVWANWLAFGADAAAIDAEGRAISAGLEKLKWLVDECDRRGMVVDVTFTRGGDDTGPLRLPTLKEHSRAVETVITALKPWRNWYLDLSNERNIHDSRFTSIDDLKRLRELALQLDPALLITASHGGDIGRDELRDYLQTARVDFISPHRPRDARSPSQTEAKTREYLGWMKDLGRVVPVHYQEPLRRGYGGWNPKAEDFVADLRGAMAGGAAGWCFHNGAQHGAPDGRPRRSFDLRENSLFDQLDPEELRAIERSATIAKKPLPD